MSCGYGRHLPRQLAADEVGRDGGQRFAGMWVCRHCDAWLRTCCRPGCPAAYNAIAVLAGEPAESPGPWRRISNLSLDLCPDHLALWLSDDHHRPALTPTSGQAACACGAALPGPTLGAMSDSYRAHLAQAVHDEPVTVSEQGGRHEGTSPASTGPGA